MNATDADSGRSFNLVPGPSPVPQDIANLYSVDYPSPDLDLSFFDLYARVQVLLQELLNSKSNVAHDVVIWSGEGMLGLWGALKSVVKPGERVLALATGVFGYGVAEMGEQIGAEVKTIGLEFDEVFTDFSKIKEALDTFKPKLVTLIHCETPSGTLNPIREIGQLVRQTGALFYVDFVSSGMGCEVNLESCGIDLGILGSQKCLSLPPDLTIVTVSPKAWTVIEQVKYFGYDALLAWKTVVKDKVTPYTHNWRAMAALEHTLLTLKKEGMEAVWKRHEEVAAHCRKRVKSMGLKLFPKEERFASPTVTAIYVPDGWTYEKLETELKKKGVTCAGSYGKIAGKVFRLGHMGHIQARIEYMDRALDILEAVLKST